MSLSNQPLARRAAPARDQLSIVLLAEEEAQRWDGYVFGAPEATFFHLSAWRRILAAEFRCETHYLYAERGDRIVGVLPLCRVKNLLAGNVLTSSPFLVYGGPVGDDEAVRTALAEAASDLALKLKVDYLELRNRTALDGDWEVRSLYKTFRKELLPEVNANLTAIPRKQRAMVRKGLKADVDVSWDPAVAPFYGVFSESYRNLGTPVFARSLFNRLLEVFGDQVWMTTLRKDGVVLASVMSFVFRDEVLPYYGGGGHAARAFAANDLMYWLVMERAVEAGLRWFDFGRSKVDTGSFRFKKHWGFEPVPLAYQYRLVQAAELPNLSPTNPSFRLPIEVWKRLPLGVSRLLGPTVARRLT